MVVIICSCVPKRKAYTLRHNTLTFLLQHNGKDTGPLKLEKRQLARDMSFNFSIEYQNVFINPSFVQWCNGERSRATTTKTMSHMEVLIEMFL